MTLINDRGVGSNILVAMVLVIIATIATISLIAVVNEDVYTTNVLQDSLQEDLLLRSEVKRITIMLEDGKLVLSRRVVSILAKERNVTYYVDLLKKFTSMNTFMGLTMDQVATVQALCTARYSKFRYSGLYSPVKKFMEKNSARESLAKYQYFSDTEKSDISDGEDDAARVKFWGNDELFGKVHSNSDIWLQNGIKGGTTCVNPANPNWPWFHDMVTTSGHFRIYSSGIFPTDAQKEAIFEGGWEEEVPTIAYQPTAERIRRNGLAPFGVTFDENKIYKLYINRASLETTTITLLAPQIDTFVVYSNYPDALHPTIPNNPATYIGDSLWTNRVSLQDSIWVVGPTYGFTSKSFFIPGVTWVDGLVAGKLTIGCQGNAYITGNITYANTTIEQPPDDPDQLNRYDYFGLVAEGSIIIKYKYYDKLNEVINSSNSQGPNGNVYLYGAYAAIGAEDEALEENSFRTAGVFTYEYQHPHGATTPYRGFNNHTGRDTLYTFIDLHRYMYKPLPPITTGAPAWKKWPNLTPNDVTPGYPVGAMAGFPYYPTVDYPWVNPVWPEAVNSIVYERGTLWIFGSIAQRRRGFVHRSGTVNASNPDQGAWNPEEWKWGPGHASTGYGKKYYYDKRFYFVQPPDYPEVYKNSSAGLMSAFEDSAWGFKIPPKQFPK